MFKFGKKVASAVIAYSIVFGSMAWAPVGKKNVVRADEKLYDSASAINYATILGGAVDYGIVAGTIEQTSHTETTFATNHFIHTSSNIDVDYVNSTALFLIGRQFTPGDGNEKYIRFGRTTASAIYFEAPVDVFGDYNPAIQAGTNIVNGNFRFEGEYTDTPFIAAENENAFKNVDRLIDRICSIDAAEDVEKGWSYFLESRALDPRYVLNPEGEACPFITYDGDAHVYIDLTSPQFNEKVVYINISGDSPLRKYLGKSSGFQIKKNESSVVVINIEEDGKNVDLNLNKPIVTVDGVDYSGVTATNGGDPVGAAAVQKNFNETIVWNVMDTSPVLLTDMGGAVLAPLASSVSLSGGNSSGWVVTPNRFNMNTEFHFLYSGSSKDSYGQMHFALNKAFTKQFAKHGEVKQDTSVSIPDNSTYKFYFQEYRAPSQLHGDLVTPVGAQQYVYAQTNAAVTFPVLTFYCKDYDSLTDAQKHFYIERPTSGTASKTYYFKVTEDPSSPVGITNSTGYIDIRLKVQVDSAGKFTYFVDYKSVTGDNIVFRDYEEDYKDFITMSGVQFDLGSFYNKVNDGVTICKTDVAGGTEIDGAILKITRTGGEGSFSTDGISAIRTNTDGTTTTLVKNTSGSTPGSGELLINESESSVSYKTDRNGNVTIKGLPDGSYTLTEITAPDGYEYAEDITFEISGGNVVSCKDANGNTITMIDKKNVSFKIAKQTPGNTTANIAGAKLTLSSVEGYDLSGATVTGCNGEPQKNGSKISVETTGEALTFGNLPSGRYVLSEDAAPAGFEKQSSIKFKVDSMGVITFIGDVESDQGKITDDGTVYTLAMIDAIQLKIRKQNKDGHQLNGAVFQIYEADGKTKVGSSLSIGDYSTVLSEGNYILREEVAPDGYATAKDIEFSVVVENGIGTIKVDGTAVADNTIVVTDDQGYRVKIKKQYWDLGFKPLEGARMTLAALDGSTGNPSWYWTSDSNEHVITGLVPGVTYTLTEESAPRGYVKVDPITFTIDPIDANAGTCNIVLSQNDSGRLLKQLPYEYNQNNPYTHSEGDLYYVNNYDAELTLYDDINEDEVGKIVLTKTIKGPVTDEDIKGLTFKVKDENGNAIWTHKLSDSVFTVTTDADGNKVYTATIDKLNINKQYIVEETLHTIAGFDVEVSYKVDGVPGTGETTGKFKPTETGTNVDYEDKYTYKGELKVSKALNGITGSSYDDKVFTFKVKVGESEGYLQADGTIGPDAYAFTVTPSEICKVPVDYTAFNKALTVIEYDTDRDISGYMFNSVGYSDNNGTVAITSNTDDKTVAITNFYKPDTKNGSIILTKTIKGPVTEEDLSTGINGIVFEIWEEGKTDAPYATLTLGTDFAPGQDLDGNPTYTKTITGLDTDKTYTIKETKYVFDGYTVTQTYKIGTQSGDTPETTPVTPEVSGTAVDFENVYERIKGELKVTKTLKNVTGSSSKSFTFYVKAGENEYLQADGTIGTTPHPFTVKSGETCKVPVDYAAFGKKLTVEEETSGSNVEISGYDFTGVSYSSNNGTVTIDTAADDKTVSIENSYQKQPDKGYITLTKTIEGDVTDQDLKGLTFTVKDGDTVIATFTLGEHFEKVPGSGEGTKGIYKLKGVLEVDDASKTYTVEETEHDKLNGFDVKVTYSIGGGEDKPGTKASVTGVNTDSNKPTEIAYTNDYTKTQTTPDKGYITLTKTIEGDVTDQDLKGLTFTVKDGDKVIATLTLGEHFEKVPGSGEGTKGIYKLKNAIEVDDASKTYTVEETEHDKLNGFDVKVTYSIGGGEDKPGTKASVTGVSTDSNKPTEIAYTNDYTKTQTNPDTGSLTLKKTLGGDKTGAKSKSFKFYVKGADGYWYDKDGKPSSDKVAVTVTEGTPVKIENIPVQKYDITEDYEDTAAEGYVFDGSNSVTSKPGIDVEKDENTDVELINAYTKTTVDTGSLTLKKTIGGETSGAKTKTFKFYVKGEDGKWYDKDGKASDTKVAVTVTEGTPVKIEKLPIQKYDITEDTDGTAADGYELDGQNSVISKPEVAVEKDGNPEVELINAYRKSTTETGSLTLKKTIGGDTSGAKTKTFKFYVKGENGKWYDKDGKASDTKVAVTVTEGTPVKIEKLPVQKYDITEDTDGTAADGYELDGQNSVISKPEVAVEKDGNPEVELINSYKKTTVEKGSLTLKKTIGGETSGAKSKSFKFYVKGEDGKWYDKDGKASSDKVAITVTEGTPVKIENLPVQKYTITEDTANTAADGYVFDGENSVITRKDVEVTVDGNPEAELINAYKKETVDTGDLTLKKTIGGETAGAKSKSFKFYVKGEDGKWYDKDGKASSDKVAITVTEGTPVKIEKIPVQKYTITEDTANTAADGYELDGENSVTSRKDVEVIKDTNTDAELINAYKVSTTPETGSLKVTKAEAGDIPSGKPSSYSFYVKSGSKYLKADGTFGDKDDAKKFTVEAGGEAVEVKGLELGKTYSIEEASFSVPDGYKCSITYSASSNVTLDSNNKTGSVKITNTYIKTGSPSSGSLTVVKKVTGSVASSGMPDTYRFYVKCGDQFVQADGSLGDSKHMFEIGPNKSVNIKNLAIDGKTYEVVEEQISNSDLPDGYKISKPEYSPASLTLTDTEDSGTIVITNKYTKTTTPPVTDKGSLTLKKTVTGPDGCTKTDEFKFYVRGADKKWYDKDGNASTDKVAITVKAGSSVKIDNLPVQTYTITEDDASKAAASGFEFNGNDSVVSRVNVEVEKDGNPEAELINVYKKTTVDYGSLTLKKTLGGETAGAKTTSFKFYVKGENGKWYDKDGKASDTKVAITVTAGTPVKIEKIPVQKYTITEDTSDTAADGYEFDGENSVISRPNVEVEKDGSAEAELINAYKKTTVDTGSLTLKKTLGGDTAGAKTTSFKFYVKGENGKWYNEQGEKSDSKVAITVTAGTTVKIEKIPVQKYEITEETDGTAEDGYELDGENSVTSRSDVGVTKDTNTEAELINAYKKSTTTVDYGSLTLKKTLGGDTAGAKSTSFKFYVKGDDGKWYNEQGEKSDSKVSITVTAGTTVKIEKIPVQKYEITEETDGTAEEGYELDGQNSVTSRSDVGVTKDTNTDAELINAYKKKTTTVDYGSLTLKKTLGGETAGANTTSFKFYVKGEDGYWYNERGEKSDSKVAITVTAGTPVKIEKIPVQKYDITEDYANTAASSYEFDSDNSVTSRTGVNVTKDANSDAELINAYKKSTVKTGKLSINKTFAGDVLEKEASNAKNLYFIIERTDAPDANKYLKANGTFTSNKTEAHITLADMSHTSGTLKWSLTFASVPVGKYKITEYNTVVNIENTSTALIFETTKSVTSDSTEVEETTPGTFALKNTYSVPDYDVKISKQDIAKKELPKATLTLTSLDGFDLSGATVKQGSKTISVKVSSDKKSISFVTGTTPSTVSGLKPGRYELKETVTPEAYLKADAIKFTLNRDGSKRLDGSTDIIVTGSPIVMIDKADPNYKKKAVPATGVGISPTNVIGAVALAAGAACCAGIVIYLFRKKRYL